MIFEVVDEDDATSCFCASTVLMDITFKKNNIFVNGLQINAKKILIRHAA